MSDLISREEAIEVVKESFECGWYLMETISHIEELPTIEERKKGKWIYRPEIGWGEAWVCSECEEITKATKRGKPRHNYCPNCGADMRGGKDA